ncbi:MAG TPA: class I SAM-dependent methyltransferase [Vicinamibacterales bacterium]|nr:class I SAM-dependent methyltransferase [Vicinamibacterales bacterium]
MLDDSRIRAIAGSATSREELWTRLVSAAGVETMVEIGVFRGDFSAEILAHCPRVSTYFMIDPWRHLDGWNKPANVDDRTFAKFFLWVRARTAQWPDRIRILRGRTVDVIDHIADQSLDLAYIDADHTLRGITIDLVRSYPKIRDGGWIGGDDFMPDIWQHPSPYDPTLVFPFAVHFAEAVGAEIYALPFYQFLFRKSATGFRFIDLTAQYPDVSLRLQCRDGS